MLGRALPPTLLSLVLLVARAAAAPHDFPENYSPETLVRRRETPGLFQPPRDGGRLVYDVVGIVGGYVATVLIWGILLLTVGRRMRRKALEPPKHLELELQDKPALGIKTPGPNSPPLTSRSWFKKFGSNKKNDSAVASPVVQSPASFDQRVVDAHKDQAQADMERLYAAVMDHDAKKNYSKVSLTESEANANDGRRRPSNISTTRSTDESPISPVKAIYPPDFHGAPRDRLREPQQPASPRSVLSKKSQASATSTTKSTRFNLKNLRISGNSAQKYPGAAADDEARTPLSPRFYQNNVSPTQTASPTTPYDPSEELDQVQPLPRPAPQRLGSIPSSPNQNVPGLSIQPSKSATSSASSLPLRSFAEPLKSPGIQTTVLDRRVDKLSMTTPKTGVPFTPYSPYMPFTPVTPVTPHLVGRKERKERQRAERKGRGEMVQSPKEIFGDAY